MKTFSCSYIVSLLLSLSAFADTIDTFYGPIDVDEPILLELIYSNTFQRLKEVHQYGVAFYATSYNEPYNRYEHSLGVFVILRKNNASLKEQIAGLLHDVSHTAFSHVGDWVFGKEHQEIDYQNSTHKQFLEESGLEQILNRYGYLAEEIMPEAELFPMLEQKSPNLSADRLEYNIQGAYYQGFITYEEVLQLYNETLFKDGFWISENKELMVKLVRFSLFMTLDCWGSASNHFLSRTLADAILRALEIGLISLQDIRFGTDDILWNRLITSNDEIIKSLLDVLFHPGEHFCLVDPSEADEIVRSKFRGIDPWIKTDQGPNGLQC